MSWRNKSHICIIYTYPYIRSPRLEKPIPATRYPLPYGIEHGKYTSQIPRVLYRHGKSELSLREGQKTIFVPAMPKVDKAHLLMLLHKLAG